MDSVTKAYKTCVDTGIANAKERLSDGSLIDLCNNDYSMNRIQETTGWKGALESLSDLGEVLSRAKMIEVDDDKSEV